MKLVWWVLILAILIQVVPFGHSHTNPAVTKERDWDSSDSSTRAAAIHKRSEARSEARCSSNLSPVQLRA